MSLAEFVKRVQNFDQLSSSNKIDYFIFYLLEHENVDGVQPKDILNCFERLNLNPYSNIPNYLVKYSQKGKTQKYLKRNGKYFLKIQQKIEFTKKL